ncbi:hypothetical protein E9993_07100 [Labilibacter sediminis]|nr:hypothetical protein E9993_07100 [Labilibacter sediminis]
MKTAHTIVTVLIFLTSCKKEVESYIHSGLEIYSTKIPYYSWNFDYNSVNLDTVQLSEVPVLHYSDLIKYDTLTHKLTLAISHDSLQIDNVMELGEVFVLTLNKEPIYCGFRWPMNYSNPPPPWVFIEEPLPFDKLQENEIVISYESTPAKDPRLDKRIIDRLKKDGKIE